ncbi:metalloprotease TIKI1 [Caerostris extrusa]|uniref:Metalloprotease TIKI homolog n=1 Tax=Caerostris extrusa TaxID=172846 RepID=A0AAV4TKH9_CAEEX|nr:metalloprotease TIKI1 [Caerostris extrusa]
MPRGIRFPVGLDAGRGCFRSRDWGFESEMSSSPSPLSLLFVFLEFVIVFVLFALNQTLVRLEELRNGRPSPFYGTEDLVRHYNCRNITSASFTNPDVLSDTGNATDELLSSDINRYFRQELIEKRNARMAHRVLQLLHQYPDESFFFAFGTGTLILIVQPP